MCEESDRRSCDQIDVHNGSFLFCFSNHLTVAWLFTSISSSIFLPLNRHRWRGWVGKTPPRRRGAAGGITSHHYRSVIFSARRFCCCIFCKDKVRVGYRRQARRAPGQKVARLLLTRRERGRHDLCWGFGSPMSAESFYLRWDKDKRNPIDGSIAEDGRFTNRCLSYPVHVYRQAVRALLQHLCW